MTEKIHRSVLNVIKIGVATLCQHCSGTGVTQEACCNVKAGLELVDEQDHVVCCCSCQGRGYHLLPEWAAQLMIKKSGL